jgi:PAS domain S-box-containing protein
VLLVASRDITSEILYQKELIENEQQLSLIFESIKDAMWLLKVEGIDDYRVETVNKAYELVTGLKKESCVGKLINEILPTDILERSLTKYNQVVQTGNAGRDFITMTSVHGELIAEITITPIKNYTGKVVRLLATAVDVTQQQRARKELVKMNLELRQLTGYLQNIREEERTHMAREIHDELGQQLTGLKMDLSWLKKKVSVDEVAITDKLKSALQLIDVTINTVRKIASELRPGIIDDLGITDALDWQCQEFTNRTGIHVNFKSNIKELHLSKDIPTALFRLVQEALTNVARHSNAT